MLHNYPYTCPTCHCELEDDDMYGWVFSSKQNEQIPCPECSPDVLALRQKHLTTRLLSEAGLPKRMRGWTFATSPRGQRDRIMRDVRDFALPGEKLLYGMYLHGNPGVGKTGLAVSYAQASAEQGIPVLFIPSSELFLRIRAGNTRGDGLLEVLRTKQRIVIDDLGTEKPSSYVLEQLYILISHRHNEELETFITSNFDLDQMEEHWSRVGPDDDKIQLMQGLRIIERLAEYCAVLDVEGLNHRAGGR